MNSCIIIFISALRFEANPLIGPGRIEGGNRTGMVDDHIHENADAMLMRRFYKPCQLLFGSGIGIDTGPVADPIPMIAIGTPCSFIGTPLDLFKPG